MSDSLWVVVGLVERGSDILIAKRPNHVDQGGLWEFPGGKRESSESAEVALRRELKEEVGIDILNPQPAFQFEHSYPNQTIFFDCWWVRDFHGEPHGCEGQQVQWIPKRDLTQFAFPQGNATMVARILDCMQKP